MRRHLAPRVSVSGQIQPRQISDLAAAGVTLLICNRPDREEPGQPTHADLAQAAESAGGRVRDGAIHGGPTPAAAWAV